MKNDLSYEKKLEVVAKAFFDDCRNDPDYPFETWQEQRDEMRESTSFAFINSGYESLKDNPKYNTEVDQTLN